MRKPAVIWSLLAAFLIAVGLFPSAAAPVHLAASGAAVILAAIPGPVLLLAAAVAWLRHKPSTPKSA